MFDAAAVPSTIVLRERHTGGTRTVLEIEHDGSDPPEALLAELREIGWLGAISVPPPASAIDWSRPDPVTGHRFSIRRHRAVVHANLGAIRDRTTDLTRGTWGLGLEALLFAPRVYGVLETYGQKGEKPTLHYGLRFWILPNRFQVDATHGEQDASDTSPARRFNSIGLRLLW